MAEQLITETQPGYSKIKTPAANRVSDVDHSPEGCAD